MGVDVVMYAEYTDRNGPVRLYLGAYLPARSNQVQVIIEKKGDHGWHHVNRVGLGESKIFTIEGDTYKIWERGGTIDQGGKIVDANINLELCPFNHCFH